MEVDHLLSDRQLCMMDEDRKAEGRESPLTRRCCNIAFVTKYMKPTALFDV